MANLNQSVDISIFQMVTIAVATFAVVTLTGGAAKRFNTSLAANVGTNKQILSEAGDLLAVTMVAQPTYLTVLGVARRELEASEGTATTY